MPSNMFEVERSTVHRQETGIIHTFFLSDEVKIDDNTQELIKTLKFCGPSDLVNIYINTHGGDMYTTMQIINSIRGCSGKVATHADGLVASAGSLVFFAGDMLSVSDLTSFLIHNGSASMGGKYSDIVSSVKHDTSVLHKIFHSVYQPFFSEEEIDKVLSGIDIHLGAEQVIGRIDKVCNAAEESSKDENIPKPEPEPDKPKRVRKPKAKS